MSSFFVTIFEEHQKITYKLWGWQILVNLNH